MPRSTVIALISIVSLGLLLAVAYLFYRSDARALSGYYVVQDSFIDTDGIEDASVSFVQVTEYDSMKVLRVAEILTRDAVESELLDRDKRRVYMYHFFIPGDTLALDEEMLDELAYTHPSVPDPQEKLLVVPGGWVVQASFAPGMFQPSKVETSRTQFYMPREGMSAIDLH